MSKRHTRAFWEQAAARVADGETTAVVARKLGVRPRTLTWWCWRLKREGSESRKAAFLPVVVRPVPRTSVVSAPEALELVVDGVVLRVPVGADPSYVADLLAALRDRC